jgi:hypothetical protein
VDNLLPASPIPAVNFEFSLSPAKETTISSDVRSQSVHECESSKSGSPSIGQASLLESDTPSTSSSSGSNNIVLYQPLLPVPRQYICDERGCSNRFTQPRQLEKHKRKHKLFYCNECTISFPHPKNLREHKASRHQGLRYPCDVPGCGETVTQKRNLPRHKANKHKSTFTGH